MMSMFCPSKVKNIRDRKHYTCLQFKFTTMILRRLKSLFVYINQKVTIFFHDYREDLTCDSESGN